MGNFFYNLTFILFTESWLNIVLIVLPFFQLFSCFTKFSNLDVLITIWFLVFKFELNLSLLNLLFYYLLSTNIFKNQSKFWKFKNTFEKLVFVFWNLTMNSTFFTLKNENYNKKLRVNRPNFQKPKTKNRVVIKQNFSFLCLIVFLKFSLLCLIFLVILYF